MEKPRQRKFTGSIEGRVTAQPMCAYTQETDCLPELLFAARGGEIGACPACSATSGQPSRSAAAKPKGTRH
jgi:hypothetical protein